MLINVRKGEFKTIDLLYLTGSRHMEGFYDIRNSSTKAAHPRDQRLRSAINEKKQISLHYFNIWLIPEGEGGTPEKETNIEKPISSEGLICKNGRQVLRQPKRLTVELHES